VGFADELSSLLPELPERENLIRLAARHLELIVEANRNFNLTRILDPREAAIKHVVDSVMPWRLFAEAGHVLDAGTGAGFPGIPLAVIFPSVRFTLAESIGKKARFVAAAVQELGLTNVAVANQRAEDVLRGGKVDIITARAVAPVERAVALFGPALQSGSRALLYKGPDADSEIAEAKSALRKSRLQARVRDRYDLPEGLGSRSIVEIGTSF
jgi:16S rRNA (guanine527-N7)-methyltransferase